MRVLFSVIATLLLGASAQAAEPCVLQPRPDAGAAVAQALDWAQRTFPGAPVTAVCALKDGGRLVSIAPAGAAEGTYRMDSDAAANAVDGEPKAAFAPITMQPAVMTDTAGTEWLFWDSLFLHMGEEMHMFSIARATDGKGRQLARTAGVDCDIHPDGTAVESSAAFEDANGDGVADIVLSWTETGCGTDQTKSFRRVYFAGPDGFSRKR